jgi:hypothetical protein
MTPARQAVLRVLRWATDGGVGPPPDGVAADADELIDPPADVRRAAGELAAVTAARLRLGRPPLGDPSPLGPGLVFLALAVALRRMPPITMRAGGRLYPHHCALIAELAVDAVANADRGALAEWVAREGLVGAAAPFVSGDLFDTMMSASPLTAVLDVPPAGQASDAMVAAERVRATPDGRRLLVRTLASPGASGRARAWRARLMEAWRLDDEPGRTLLLDVYERALTAHHSATLADVAEAESALLMPVDEPTPTRPQNLAISSPIDYKAGCDGDTIMPRRLDVPIASGSRDGRRTARAGRRPAEDVVSHALAVAAWWKPLSLVARSYPLEVRARPKLGYDYLKGIRLYKLAGRLTGGGV